MVEFQFLANCHFYWTLWMGKKRKHETREEEKKSILPSNISVEVPLPSALSSLKHNVSFKKKQKHFQRKYVYYAKCNKLDLRKLRYYDILSCILDFSFRHSSRCFFCHFKPPFPCVGKGLWLF